MSKADDQGVCLDQNDQEQPKDRESAQNKGKSTDQKQDDELQPLREKKRVLSCVALGHHRA